MNEFLEAIIKGDSTKNQRKESIEKNYGIYLPGKIKDALKIIAIYGYDKSPQSYLDDLPK